LSDGTLRWAAISASPLLGALGERLGTVAMVADISERKQAEEALRANEERFRKQYKGFPLPTYSWLRVADDFVLQDFNDAAEVITDGQIASGLGGIASDWYSHQPAILTDLQMCVTEHRTLRREMRYRYRTTGIERDLAFSYVFVPPQTVMIHTEDVTEARRAEQQRDAMAQSEKLRALGQMATGIAHDLNQSLMLVASYSDLARQAVLEDPPNLAELEDLLTTTTQAALDGGETVKRLLLFTRAAPELNSKRVDLSTVVRDAAQLTAPRWRDAAQAEGRPISLHIEAAGHPTIQGSPAQLRELMTNLIFNAVDALPTGGVIRLRVVAEHGRGIVEVADSGIGMSAAVQARVFEPFFTTKGEGGTGLGLAMVFGIVDQHGGQIEVNSAPGNGTTFRVTLPLVDASAPPEPAAAPAAPIGALVPLRILAVDDEPMMTKAVMRMLKPSGHVVSVAGSGEEALAELAEQTFDVVVSDMGMGAGMNGWELAEAVRRRWPKVRFLLATGWGAAIDPAEARAKGVEAVLAKPYQLADLLRVLTGTDKAA
jgi:signal transduction histidine kinase